MATPVMPAAGVGVLSWPEIDLVGELFKRVATQPPVTEDLTTFLIKCKWVVVLFLPVVFRYYYVVCACPLRYYWFVSVSVCQ